jgi:hypothetical protein
MHQGTRFLAAHITRTSPHDASSRLDARGACGHLSATPDQRMATSRRLLLPLLLLLGSCIDTAAQQNTAGAIIDMNNELSALRQDNAVLQEQIDSLRTSLAKQDTLLRRLSAMAGMPMQ